MASVNVPSSIPFIGGFELGEVDVYLQILPGEDPTQSYFAAWTSVNVIFDTFTIGFEVDFTGAVTVLYGAPAMDLGAGAATTSSGSTSNGVTIPYTYPMPITITDPNSIGAQVTVSSPAFASDGYPTTSYDETVTNGYTTTTDGIIQTYYRLSHPDVIVKSLAFEVYAYEEYGGTDIGSAYFDDNLNFHFVSNGSSLSEIMPTGGTLDSSGDVTLTWSQDPLTTELSAQYSTPNATLQVLQQTTDGSNPVIDTYYIDPVSTDDTAPTAALGGAVYNDQVSSAGATQYGNLWESTYQLTHGPVNLQSLSFTVSAGGTVLGTGSFDANAEFHFKPTLTPPFVPTSAGVDGNGNLDIFWAQEPGATSVSVSYSSLADRILNINLGTDTVPDGLPGQYIVELVSSTQLDDNPIAGYPNGQVPMFTQSTHYTPPNVSFLGSAPTIGFDGSLQGTLVATSYNPATVNPGDTSTTVSLYYSTENDTTSGKLIATYNYSNFISLNPSQPIFARDFNFQWAGYQNLPAGQYWVYAVVNDGQSPPQFSATAGPYSPVDAAPVLSAPSFVALSVDDNVIQPVTFSKANGNALVITTPFANPVGVDLKVTGGGISVGGDVPVAEFTRRYASSRLATAALEGVTFVPDDTFTGGTTLSLTVSSVIAGVSHNLIESIPLAVANTHLLIAQNVDTTTPADPDTVILTVTASNPGGPNDQPGTNVQVQNYLSAGLTIVSSSASQGSFDPTTELWTIGNLPVSATPTATLTLTLHADSSTYDQPLSNTADASSTLLNYPESDAVNTVGITPQSHDVVFNPGTLPAGAVKSPYTWQFTAEHGAGGPYIFTVRPGSLPPGLSLDPSGFLSGVLTAAGMYSFAITASSAAGLSTPEQVQIAGACAPIAVVGTGYSYQVTTANLTYYTVTPGSTLPPGLQLDTSSANPVLDGTPTTPGFYSFSIREHSEQSVGAYDDIPVTLFVDAAGLSTTAQVQIAVAGAPIAVVGTGYSYQVTTANLTYYTVTPGSTLPPGLQLDTSSGNPVLDGTPTTPGFYSFSIRENSEQSVGAYDDIPVTLFVDQAITASTTTLPTATAGSDYSQTFLATGGSGQLQFAIVGGMVPKGLHIDPYGTLSGTIDPAATPGLYTFNIFIGDASGAEIIQSVTIQVNPAIVTSPDSLSAATVTNPYSVTLTATGGTGSGYSFAVTEGALPAGLTLSSAGILGGTIPAGTIATDAAFTVTTTDPNGATADQSYILDVDPAIELGSTSLPYGSAGSDYSTILTATGGSGTGYAFSMTGGRLPTGLTLTPDGRISGTIDPAAAAGSYNFTVTTTDSLDATGFATCSIFVDALMNVPTPKLPDAVAGTPYSQQLTATGGSAIFTFAVTAGNLPAGFMLSANGVLSDTIGISTPPGTYNFVVTATDSLDNICTCNATLNVDAAVNLTWTGAVSTVWSNPANWSPHLVPGADTNVTIPGHPTNGRCPVLDTAATVNNLTLQSGASLTLSGHGLTVDGSVINKGTVLLQGNESVSLAHGNDTAEGTWQYVGDGSAASLMISDFGPVDYFNLTICDPHKHADTFKTSRDLAVNGGLAVTCGTFAPASSVTACGIALSGTGVLDAPATLNDSGNWTVTGGTFNPDGGTVFFTGTGTEQLTSGGRAFFNLTHSGSGTVGLAGTALTVKGALSDAGGSGNLRTNNLGVTVTGPTTFFGGAFNTGSAVTHFNGGLTLDGGNFLGSTGIVSAAGVTLTMGTLTAPRSTLSDSGDWIFMGGTFNADNGTVALTGSNQHVVGSTTFHNLTKTVRTADTLTFQAGATETITGTLTLEGIAGHLLALRSSEPGTQWDIDPLSAALASFVDVEDSGNIGKKAITAKHSRNSGDDMGWKIT